MLTFNLVWCLLEIRGLRKGHSCLCEDMMRLKVKGLFKYVTLLVMLLTLPAQLICMTIQCRYFPKQTYSCWDSFVKRRERRNK